MFMTIRNYFFFYIYNFKVYTRTKVVIRFLEMTAAIRIYIIYIPYYYYYMIGIK